jgi:NAD(P)-dependent dehydrogenase (short-subunit alcohol dehydrogenase family)
MLLFDMHAECRLCSCCPVLWLLQVCDVSSLASVASFAADWLASSRPCHLLVNNAGVLVSPAPWNLVFGLCLLVVQATYDRRLGTASAGATL